MPLAQMLKVLPRRVVPKPESALLGASEFVYSPSHFFKRPNPCLIEKARPSRRSRWMCSITHPVA